MAATPHIDHEHGVAIPPLAERRNQVRTALREAGVELEVLQGGELAITRLVELTADELHQLTLGDGRHLLVECPFIRAGGLLDSAVFGLQSRGFSVLLGHPERSPEFLGNADRLEELVGRGAHVQVTAGAVGGRFGRTVQEFALELFERGLVHVLASDSHSADNRAPGARQHLEAVAETMPGLEAAGDFFTVTAPAAIVAGTPVPDPPAIAVKRSLWRRVRRR
jgi:protein-tyrosine phosphatase